MGVLVAEWHVEVDFRDFAGERRPRGLRSDAESSRYFDNRAGAFEGSSGMALGGLCFAGLHP